MAEGKPAAEDERSDKPDADTSELTAAPLADRMRPRDLGEFVGQEHLTGETGLLKRILDSGKVPSLIFWGPPGSGKTTLAYILGSLDNYEFVRLSAVTSGIPQVREVIQFANRSRQMFNRPTILFIDEIHRFNKAQQDAFLPHVERGTIVLLGATTENPSFEVISPLLSRSKVLVLESLSDDNIATLTRQALMDKERGLGESGVTIDDDALSYLARAADGDARFALNALELAVDLLAKEKREKRITLEFAQEVLTRRELLYDKTGEEHYNLISALHKAVRGSDPDAALYYLQRMLQAGEDPKYLARRMTRMASEDIGLADPFALVLAQAVFRTVETVGMPECDNALAELAIYLSAAPKSNSVYQANSAARAAVEEHGAVPVPLKVRNAPTELMKDLGYGKDYRYAHGKSEHAEDGAEEATGGFVAESYLPDELAGAKFYEPKPIAAEKKIKDLLEKRWGKKE